MVPFRTPFSASILGVKESRYAKFDIKQSESIVFGLYENPIRFPFALFVPEIFAFEKWSPGPGNLPRPGLGPKYLENQIFPGHAVFARR